MAFANGANGSSLTRVSNNEMSASTTNVVKSRSNNRGTKPLKATNNEPVITFTTSKKIGQKIELRDGRFGFNPLWGGLKIEGATLENGSGTSYVLTAQTVKIIGNCTSFGCSGSGITSIDLSKNSWLKKLYCSSNQLTQIKLSEEAKSLRNFHCASNNIDVEHMEQLINSLPKRTDYRYGKDDYNFTVQSSSTDGNQITKEQAQKAKDKGWSVLDVYKYTTPTGISTIDNADASPRKVYDLNGCEVNENQAKGVVIVKQGNKTYKKVVK